MTLQETIQAVEAFHNAFNISNNHQPTAELSEADIHLAFQPDEGRKRRIPGGGAAWRFG